MADSRDFVIVLKNEFQERDVIIFHRGEYTHDPVMCVDDIHISDEFLDANNVAANTGAVKLNFKWNGIGHK